MNVYAQIFTRGIQLALLLQCCSPHSAASNIEDMIASPEGQQRLQQFQKVYDNESAKPINVYGKVVDQHGNPVVGAEVVGGTMLYVSAERSSGEDFPPVITDAKGLFSFVGFHGARFGVKISKTGYDYNASLFVGWWDNYTPDPSNPAIFTMWKLAGAEHLIQDKEFYGISPDGKAYTIDLIKGTASGSKPAGDLRVTIQRPAQIIPNQHFDWSFPLGVVGGGLIETNDAYLNEAPESGYQQQYALQMPSTTANWQEELQSKNFYIKSRDGKVYGRIHIEVIPNYNKESVFKFESFVNPAGSRNLEIDTAKVTKAGGSNPAP